MLFNAWAPLFLRFREVSVYLKQTNRSNLVLALFFYIPVVWAALLIAQSLGGGLPELLENLTAALQSPLEIHWTNHSAAATLDRCSAQWSVR